MSNFELVLKLLLQLTVILAACRIVTILGKRFLGQTDVVCEMIAGVMLGPSLFGAIAPSLQQWLFPKAPLILATGEKIPNPSMSILFAISQIGLVLYMFLIGVEFNTDLIKQRIKSAGLVSGAGILAPFSLGAIAAFFLYGQAELFKVGVTPWAAALYLGASMSITAFPMLARMLYERGIAKTRFGTLALAAGSMDDATAWCLLAIVLASLQADASIAAFAIGGGLTYVLLTIFIGRPTLKIFTRMTKRDGGLKIQTLILVLIVLMFCSWLTDAIKLYAVFGAFILGTAMPRGEFAEQLRDRLEYLTTAFLLPIFFVFSGLSTQLGLVNTPYLWAITALIVAIAIFGKGIACMLAAKIAGETWRESATIGALMNARGLMELIILNIGLEQGIITPTLFTIMVIMAIVTTLMASPLVNMFLKGTVYEQSSVQQLPNV
ncbi:MAG: cation:proton antiporter [Pelatocladus maniniholoensis HA4357-MV3]|jgi:Kef-type K+ transport system membrane component KefB|uniref:Cation:proton antiporter n=1 Tax=Pelatocladus maniniholoensis HA4357-MV3 TaxID=1117104 RepID=A0A9E3LTA8_9NOST|nr:cation:proton antiporter [Pelatocladus maniniholoensis HA4357-MV3]BAZ66686.1 sodium/hydrogen exchanger [Fischerella sp. NIES-4106]